VWATNEAGTVLIRKAIRSCAPESADAGGADGRGEIRNRLP
jgi:hypothetical protein